MDQYIKLMNEDDDKDTVSQVCTCTADILKSVNYDSIQQCKLWNQNMLMYVVLASFLNSGQVFSAVTLALLCLFCGIKPSVFHLLGFFFEIIFWYNM